MGRRVPFLYTQIIKTNKANGKTSKPLDVRVGQSVSGTLALARPRSGTRFASSRLAHQGPAGLELPEPGLCNPHILNQQITVKERSRQT